MKVQPLEFEKPIIELENKLEDLKRHSRIHDIDFDSEVRRMEAKIEETKREIYMNLTAWQRVQIARHSARPFALDYFNRSFSDFIEIHGDRLFGDDKAMPAGFATVGAVRCAVVGHQKGRDTKENLKRNFGSAHPEGYRKALRLMRLAEKFRPPAGRAHRHSRRLSRGRRGGAAHSEAIAVNIREMMVLRTPIVAVVIGEGGSGGALGIGVADRVVMFENSYYSVISPEGCAAILWKHRNQAPAAAEALKLTARDLEKLKLVDEVIPEAMGGAHQDPEKAFGDLKKTVLRHLKELSAIPTDKLLAQRYAKFRRVGEFIGDTAEK